MKEDNIGDKIKRLRINKNMTQEELGTKIGVKKAAIQKYENGTVQNLKRSTIQKLATILDVTPVYLMGWEDDSSKNNIEGKESIPSKADPSSYLSTISDEQLITELKRRNESLANIIELGQDSSIEDLQFAYDMLARLLNKK